MRIDYSNLQRLSLLRSPTHQFDVSVSNDGAELAQVPHQPVENLSNALPLVAAHFPDTGQLRLQRHQVVLWEDRKEKRANGKMREERL